LIISINSTGATIPGVGWLVHFVITTTTTTVTIIGSGRYGWSHQKSSLRRQTRIHLLVQLLLASIEIAVMLQPTVPQYHSMDNDESPRQTNLFPSFLGNLVIRLRRFVFDCVKTVTWLIRFYGTYEGKG
jgi:hypothetical protein